MGKGVVGQCRESRQKKLTADIYEVILLLPSIFISESREYWAWEEPAQGQFSSSQSHRLGLPPPRCLTVLLICRNLHFGRQEYRPAVSLPVQVMRSTSIFP